MLFSHLAKEGFEDGDLVITRTPCHSSHAAQFEIESFSHVIRFEHFAFI